MQLSQWKEAKEDAFLRANKWFESGNIALRNGSTWEAERCNSYGFAWQAIAEHIDALLVESFVISQME